MLSFIVLFDVDGPLRKLLRALLTGGHFSNFVNCMPTPLNSVQTGFIRSNKLLASL